MDASIISALAALGGALIGSASSVATIVVQAKLNDRRERVRQAAMLAVEEIKLRVPHSQGKSFFPIGVYVHYQFEILQALEKGDLTAERLREIANENFMLASTMTATAAPATTSQ
jgi:hypothetical protein